MARKSSGDRILNPWSCQRLPQHRLHDHPAAIHAIGHQGRVFGLVGTITMGLSPIAMGLSGVVADLTGQNIPLIYISGGAITFILTLAISFSGQYRRFLAFEPSDPVPGSHEGLVPVSSE